MGAMLSQWCMLLDCFSTLWGKLCESVKPRRAPHRSSEGRRLQAKNSYERLSACDYCIKTPAALWFLDIL